MKFLTSHRRATRQWGAEEMYIPPRTRRPMSERAQAIRNIIAAVLVYAGLWWIAVEATR